MNLHVKHEGSECNEMPNLGFFDPEIKNKARIMNFIDISNFLRSAPIDMMVLLHWGTCM